VEEFLKRKHGKAKIRYEIPQLKEILKTTYGVMVYQEQVMEIAKVLAGFSPGDADVLRKAMGKKLPEEMVVQREKFIDGAKKNKIEQKKAEKIFELMANFAGYGFNKSHSAVYALIAYQTAYLKAHYPVEFMAAQLTSDMADTDKVLKYISECRDMGIEILPPDINESRKDFTVSGSKIRFGLAAVKNVGEAAIDVILKTRQEEGQFTSIIDFCTRVDLRKVNRRVIESLIKCGAFDSMGVKRAQMMASLDKIMDISQALQRDRDNGQISIFHAMGSNGAGAVAAIELPQIEEWHESQLLSYEKEAIGFYISGHPLEKYMKELKYLTNTDTNDIKEKQDEAEVSIAGIVTVVREINTKKGDRMAFATLEDLNGSLEVILFSDVYKNSSSYLGGDVPVIVKGKIDKGEDSVKIIASALYPLEQAKAAFVNTVHIKADANRIKADSMEKIRGVFNIHTGKSPVYFHLLWSDREVVVAASDEFKVDSSEKFIKDIETLLGEGSVVVDAKG